jgi:DNA ligase-1
MRLAEIVDASGAIAATRSKKEKVQHLARIVRGLAPDEMIAGVSYLAGEVPEGRLGVGWATVKSFAEAGAAPQPSIELLDVSRAFVEIGAAAGAGSAGRKKAILGALFARATAAERTFLSDLLLGGVRQGALAGLMADAIALAFEVPAPRVRRAIMLSGAIGEVALGLKTRGLESLDAFSLRLFVPILPMLASPAEDADVALERFGETALEWKLDGARIQVHKSGDDVRIWSRRMNEVTERLPEIVESVRALPARELVLDGEAIALRDGVRPHTFQTTMRRFGRKKDVAGLQGELPLSSFYFDLLLADGVTMLDEPLSKRNDALEAIVPSSQRIERIVTSDPDRATEFWHRALETGHEGLMAKSLDSTYEAGSRGASWLKLKPAHTLDLVVLAVEWGSGRRTGWLSNIHLGARDPANGGFVMLGKTFKGMTDEMLEWQTKKFLELEVAREGHVVYLKPELVVEIALSDVQASPHYPGGLALRFARVKRYRLDKRAEEADTIETVRKLYVA